MKNTTILNEEGIEIAVDVLYTFESEITKKNYVIYTDNTKDTYGEKNIFIARYNIMEGTSKLYFDIDEKDLIIAEKMINSGKYEVKN